MNKLLAICLLLVASFNVKAQQMNFDETVKYINDKIACCAEDKTTTIIVTRSGEIKWDHVKRINLFDLVPQKVSESSKYGARMENSGILLYDFDGEWDIRLQYSNKEIDYSSLARFAARADAERVFKALVHLRSLCTKEKDPFNN